MVNTDWCQHIFIDGSSGHATVLQQTSPCCLGCLLLQNCPEVCGSKFVLGAIIPGATSQGVKVDVFVKVGSTVLVFGAAQPGVSIKFSAEVFLWHQGGTTDHSHVMYCNMINWCISKQKMTKRRSAALLSNALHQRLNVYRCICITCR